MIFNMMGGATRAQYKEFTLASDVVYPSDLVISDVEIPGGNVNGFALMKIGDDYSLTDKQIIYVYSDPDKADNKEISYSHYRSQYNEIGTDIAGSAVAGFIYNSSAKTLTVRIFLTSGFFGAGDYALVIW